METVKISRTEYQRLKRYSGAYLKIASEIVRAEELYPYDYTYINSLVKRSLSDYKKGRYIKAGSVDEALSLLKKR